jgi:hypothetical protein
VPAFSTTRLQTGRVEGGDVVVDAHVAVVDRRRLAVRHERREARVETLRFRRLVWIEHARLDRPRQQRVVDAPHHVALRVAGGQDRLGQHRARVLRLEQLDVDAGVGGELVERDLQRVRLIGRVVGIRVVDDHRQHATRLVIVTTCRGEQWQRGERQA